MAAARQALGDPGRHIVYWPLITQLLVGGGWGWKGSYHHQWARSPVGPGQGGTAGGGVVGGRASDPALSTRPALSVTVEVVGGSGDGDDAAVVQPVVIGAHQDQVGQFGWAAVFPVPDVVGVQTAGGAAAGHRAGAVAVLEGAAQPAVDQPGGAAGADDLAVALEPDFAGGVTGQVSAFGVGEQRAQMQRGDAVL